MRLRKPPWSKKALRRLGEALRKGHLGPGNHPEYSEVLTWYFELCLDVQMRLESLDWEPLGLIPVEVTSRAKTIDTLVDKLRRDHSTPLSTIGDVAGVRLEAETTLSVQSALVESMAAVFSDEVPAGGVFIKDLRDDPHSGYRAMHLLIDFPAGRCEIQVRTDLRGEWANMYEKLGDLLGRHIRYDTMPEGATEHGVVRSAHRLSQLITSFEAKADCFPATAGGYPRPHRERKAHVLESIRATQRQVDRMKGQ